MRDPPLLDWFGCRYIGWERWLPFKNVTFRRIKWEDMYFEYLGSIGCTLRKLAALSRCILILVVRGLYLMGSSCILWTGLWTVHEIILLVGMDLPY